MRKLLWLTCLAAVAAFPSTARADGIAFAGVVYGGAGVASLDERARYVTLPLPKRTMVMKLDGRGAVVWYRTVPGSWGIPMVAFDGSASGLSADGKTLVLAQPPIGRMREVSRFPVLRTRSLKPVKRVVLRGSFSFDALSPDGSTLYVIEHVNRRDVAEYQVRAYDLERERLLPYPIRDHSSNEVEMYGYPVSRATSLDGRWAYTLYEGGHHSFVHALDTVARTAVCVDLPMDTPPKHVADARLVLGPGGETLAVESGSAGTVATIDTESLSLLPVEEERQAAAPVRKPSAAAPAESFPWGLVAGALGVALAAAGLGARRLRHRPASALDEPALVLAPLQTSKPDELNHGLQSQDGAFADIVGRAVGRGGLAGEITTRRAGRRRSKRRAGVGV